MTDSLRDRIAAEVLAECAVSSPAAYRVADAVMDSVIDLLYGEWRKGYEAAERDMGQECSDGIQPFA